MEPWPGISRSRAWRPRMSTTFGLMSSSCCLRYGEHASASLGIGSRFMGGRHLRTLVMYTSDLLKEMRPSSVSRSLPAAPTKGSPCRSSLNPGASPTIITFAGHGPTPGTACVRVACSPQFLHDRMVSWSLSSSGGALSDFHSWLREGDEFARVVDRLQDRLKLLIGQRDQGEAEWAGVEAHRVDRRLERNRVGGGGHQGLDHGQQALVYVARDVGVRPHVGIDLLLHRPAGDVRDHADAAVPADSEDGKRPAVVAAPDLELLRLARADEPDLVQVAAGFLHADDAGEVSAAQGSRRGHVHRCAALDVVHDGRPDF